MKTTRGGIVTGWGIALPDKVVTNEDLSVSMDTNDAWIRERTGICERRIGGTTSGLAIEAALAALAKAGRRPDEIDGVILATTTPDQIVPGTSATVQDGIGITGGAFDVNAACSGFVYALSVAHGMLAIGAERLLVIGSETLSRITDWDDRWNLGSDGSLRHLLKCDHGGYLYMDGKEIFRKAVRAVVESAEQAIAEAGLTPDDIDVMVPHQANLRIITAACQRLGIPDEKAVVVIDRYGNTSSASIPLALVDAIEAGRLNKGDRVLLSGFGGGMTWASAVLRWGG
jgi:3-oxoacyl-[acyl-carrier-protein] synthase-3